MPCPKIADLQTCRFQTASDRNRFCSSKRLATLGWGRGGETALHHLKVWVGTMFEFCQLSGWCYVESFTAHRRKAEPHPTGMLALTRRHDHAKSCWSFENLSTWHLIWRMRGRMCQKTLKLQSVTAHRGKAMQFLREVWSESYLLLWYWCHFTILYVDQTDMFFKWLYIIVIYYGLYMSLQRTKQHLQSPVWV